MELPLVVAALPPLAVQRVERAPALEHAVKTRRDAGLAPLPHELLHGAEHGLGRRRHVARGVGVVEGLVGQHHRAEGVGGGSLYPAAPARVCGGGFRFCRGCIYGGGLRGRKMMPVVDAPEEQTAAIDNTPEDAVEAITRATSGVELDHVIAVEVGESPKQALTSIVEDFTHFDRLYAQYPSEAAFVFGRLSDLCAALREFRHTVQGEADV